MSSRILPLMKKEFIHILRDSRSLLILFLMPLLMMFVFGYAIDMDLKHISVYVCDLDKTASSRRVTEAIQGSRYFSIKGYFEDPRQVEAIFKERRARACLLIPQGFHRKLMRGDPVIGIQLDGSDANTATLIQNYFDAIYLSKPLEGIPDKEFFKIRPRILYNPEMVSSSFTVPGIVAILLIMIGALLTSVAIAREKETGTLEQILVSPIQPFEIIAGKIVPYFLIAFVIALSIIAFGCFWFGVPFLGRFYWLILFISIYLITALGIGLMISTLVATQQVAMMLSLIGTLLPSIMLSGFIFPVSSMPLPLQVVSQLVPATHFLSIIRGIMLKGNGPAELLIPAIKLAGLGLFFTGVSIRRFSLKMK